MSLSHLRGYSEWALMVALVFGSGVIAQGQESDAATEDRVIQIGPSSSDSEARAGDVENAQPAVPQYWIGLLGGPVTDELRHHVELPEGRGLLVREVVPDSPAAKAGLQQYDIMVRANDTELKDMRDLVDLVTAAGPQESAIAIEVLRHGTRETVNVTPEKRPENVTMPGGGLGAEGFGVPGEAPRDMLRFFRGQGLDADGRPFQFGPGGGVGGGLTGMPSGVSIQIHKEGDQPAHVTVERGDEKWEIVADDPESLEQLPEDLRPFVEWMLHGRGPLGLEALGEGFPALGNPEELNRRLEEMERRMEEMQRRMFGEDEQNAEQTQ